LCCFDGDTGYVDDDGDAGYVDDDGDVGCVVVMVMLFVLF
jgi:hypothetical protein